MRAIGCKGKVRHADPRAALMHVDNLIAFSAEHRPGVQGAESRRKRLNIYKCDAGCTVQLPDGTTAAAWHVGHLSAARYKKACGKWHS